MGQVLDAAVKMHRHAPRVIREVSLPPPKVQVAPLRCLNARALPGRPFPAARSISASVSTRTPSSIATAAGGTKASLIPGQGCGQEGATAASLSSYHRTQSVPARPSGLPRVLAVGRAGLFQG